MNLSQKMKTLGEHYKIANFDKLDARERLNAIKDYTGAASVDAAWALYEAETKNGAVKTATTTTSPSRAVGTAVQPASVPQAVSSVPVRQWNERPIRGEVINASVPPVHVNVASPAITVNYDITTWNYVLREAWKWTQAFTIGAAVGWFVAVGLAMKAITG